MNIASGFWDVISDICKRYSNGEIGEYILEVSMNTGMNPRMLKSWERIRNKGKVRFLLFSSFWIMLGIALLVFLPDLLIRESSNFGYIFSRIILMLALSVAFGSFVWSINESRFKKSIASQPQEEEPTDTD